MRVRHARVSTTRRLAVSICAATGALCLASAMPAAEPAAPARSAATTAAKPPAARKGILLLTVDSLRTDALGCYAGGATKKTPAIDSLAQRGVRFSRGYAASVSTAPGNASIVTGALPYRTGLRHDLGGRLDDHVKTLAERLHDAGWATAAVVGSDHLGVGRGLNRGFDRYDDQIVGIRKLVVIGRSVERRAGEVVEGILAAYDALPAGRPVFLWANFHDPHYDYEAPEPQKTDYKDSPYQGEVVYLDTQIQALLTGLSDRGAASETTIVLVGAHGEGLDDHGEVGHGTYLYETTARVPLLVASSTAGARRGAVVDQPVSVLDVAPTILDLAGVPGREGLDGVSLAGFVAAPERPGTKAAAAGRDAPRQLFVEAGAPRYEYGWSPLFAVIEGDRKIVQGTRLEAFDLSTDPGEAKPLEKPPAWAKKMEAWGEPLLGTFEPPPDRQKAILKAQADLDLPFAASPLCAPRNVWPDPRDPGKVAVSSKLFVARVQGEQGIAGYAGKAAFEVLQDDPGNYTALDLQVNLGIRNHWGDMLLEPLETLTCQYPFSPAGYHLLGHFYEWKHDPGRALKLFQAMAFVEPWNDDAEFDIACTLLSMDKVEEALDHLRRSVALGGDDFVQLRKDPRLYKLRQDPRLKEIIGEAPPAAAPPGGSVPSAPKGEAGGAAGARPVPGGA